MSGPAELVIARYANTSTMLDFLIDQVNTSTDIPPWMYNVTLWLVDKNTRIIADSNTLFVFISSLLVLSMQMGFAMLEAGVVRVALRSILMKNILDVAVCSCAWLLIGNGIASGREYGNAFIGIGIPFQISGNSISWFFRLAFVATSSTIVSGSMAERTKFACYVIYTVFMSGFIYPMVSRWVWNQDGFMYFNKDYSSVLPLMDFAGCGVVHMTGGISGLVGALMVGPRPGVFIDNEPIIYSKKEEIVRERLKATQLLFCVMGTMVLWFGWYGFNCGSSWGIIGVTEKIGTIAVNTTLAAVFAALTGTIFFYVYLKVFLLDKILMGILAGLVSITAGCPWVSPGAAISIGCVSFFVYYGSEQVLYKLKIDDPVAAFPIHGCCGAWGLISTGIFQQQSKTGVTTPIAQLGYQIGGTLIILVWTVTCSVAIFSMLKWFLNGSIRLLNVESEYKILEGENPRSGPLGDVTLIFTDIQGSTVLWESNPEAMAEALVLHDACIRALIKKMEGFEVKTEGDAFMIAFSSPIDALKFCIQCQYDLLTISWPRGIYACKCACVEESRKGEVIFKGVRVRMGVHSGTPTGKENPVTLRTDYFGKDVNYAGRVASAGAGGQILISSKTLEPMLPYYSDALNPLRASVPPSGMRPGERYPFEELKCSVEYLGTFRLKGINVDSTGESLYCVKPHGLEDREFPPLAVEEYSPGVPGIVGKCNLLSPMDARETEIPWGQQRGEDQGNEPTLGQQFQAVPHPHVTAYDDAPQPISRRSSYHRRDISSRESATLDRIITVSSATMTNVMIGEIR